MSNFKVVSIDQILVFKSVNWESCFICQEDDEDLTILPSRKTVVIYGAFWDDLDQNFQIFNQ